MGDIYLDAASTTKPKKEVIEAMMPYFECYWHNPSSLYKPAEDVKKKIEEAREMVGKFIGAKGKEIFFTSGGSEGNCWAITGFVNQCLSMGIKPIVITSTIEHKSIMECVENINVNAEIHFIGVDKLGFVKIDALERLLEDIKKTNNGLSFDYKILVSIQYANNEIGTIQPIDNIAELVHSYGGIFHTDAVQAFGNLPINVNELNVDMLSVSGHKVGCPKGIGFLYKKECVKIQPLIYGSQMDSMRGGTENIPYIIGMAKAIELMKYDMQIESVRNYFIILLKELGCTINGAYHCRLTNNINVTFHNHITGEALIYMLDTCGIYASTGSACNSHSIEPSYVLKAIGLTDAEAMRTVRFTLTSDIDEDIIDKVIYEIERAITIIESDI